MMTPTLSHAASHIWGRVSNDRKARAFAIATFLMTATVAPAFGQTNPWESAVSALQTSFTGLIAKG